MGPVVWRHVRAALGERQPVGSPCVVSLGRMESCEGNPTLEQVKESDREGAADMSYGLTTAPIACSPVCLGRGDVEESKAWWF